MEEKNKNKNKKRDSFIVRLFDSVNSTLSPPVSCNARIIVKSIMLALAVMSVVFFIATGADLTPSSVINGALDKAALETTSGSGYPVNVSGGSCIDIDSMSYGVVALTDSSLIVLNDSGQEVFSSSHYMSSPVIKTGGRYILTYDEGGTRYMLSTISGTSVSDSADNDILMGDASSSGRFALVTSHDSALACVTVYSKNGSVLHQWKSGSYYVSDVAVSPSGNYIAMSCLSSDDSGELQGSVIIQKVGEDENLRVYNFSDQMFLQVEFVSSDTVAAVGESLCAYCSVGEESYTSFDYGGKTLCGFDFADNGRVALLLSQYTDGRSCRVTVLNKSGETVADISTQFTKPSVELTNSGVNFISGSVLYCYDLDGSLDKKIEVSADSQETVTFKGNIIVRGISSISLVEP